MQGRWRWGVGFLVPQAGKALVLPRHLQRRLTDTSAHQQLAESLRARVPKVAMKSLNNSHCLLLVLREKLDQASCVRLVIANCCNHVMLLGRFLSGQSCSENCGECRLVVRQVLSASTKARCRTFQLAMLMVARASKIQSRGNC